MQINMWRNVTDKGHLSSINCTKKAGYKILQMKNNFFTLIVRKQLSRESLQVKEIFLH